MKAMILAAGLGTRLRPLTKDRPKPLLPVAGRPLIEWNLLWLRQHGIRDVMINLHYLGEMIPQALGDGSAWGLRLHYSYEPNLLGTGGGIKAVESFWEGESFVVVNGDTLIDLDLTECRRVHRSRQAVVTMVVRDDPDVERWGVVEVTAEGWVLTVNGRGVCPPDSTPIQRYMFAGVQIMDPRLLTRCPPNQPSSIIDAYVEELAQGGRIYGYVHQGYWSDVGTPERYAQAQTDLSRGPGIFGLDAMAKSIQGGDERTT